jgi:hypothetical protein
MEPNVKRSDSIASLGAALAKAQGVIVGAAKDRKNPHFNNAYADLASVWDACRAPLSSNGLAVVQDAFNVDGGRVGVRTLLIHSSGEYIQSELTAKPAQDTPQAVGSVITYLRRYSLASLVGVAPDDDDGNAASGRGEPERRDQRTAPKRESRPQQERQEPTKPVNPAHDPSWAVESAAFCAELGKLGCKYEDVAEWCSAIRGVRPSGMPADQRAKMLAHLRTEKGMQSLVGFLETGTGK